MGDDWDDDDEWDDDAIEQKLQAQLKEKEKERRREEGLDSESEEEEKATSAAQAPKPKPKPKPKNDEKKVEEPKLSPEEEKLRRQKLVEEADARLAQDLFSGIDAAPKDDKKAKEEAERKAKEEEEEKKKKEAAKPKVIYNDAYEKVELKVQADVEKLSDGCVKKVEAATAKGGAVRFLSDLLKQLDSKLETQDVNELTKMISDMVHQKKVSKGATDAKNNKANNKLSKTTKFNAASEWEEVYGGGAGDEEWTQEEWDEWEKQQAAQ